MKKISEDVKLGENVTIQEFTNLYGCTIDNDTRIGPFVEIQKNAYIGKRCKIQSHTFICEGVTIEDDCFVGHGVMFINDKFPGSINASGELQTEEDWKHPGSPHVSAPKPGFETLINTQTPNPP